VQDRETHQEALQLKSITRALLVMGAVVAVAVPSTVSADGVDVDRPLGLDLGGHVNLSVADVTTGGVTIADPLEATVSATVDPGSIGTSYYFEYGPNGNLSLRTPAVSLGTDLDPRQVTANLPGLAPGTTYDYRIVASGPGGLSLGPVQSFSTSPGAGSAKKGSRSACTIKGTAKSDVLRGTRKRDVICGLGGKDRIQGRGGNDVIRGGGGNDRATGGAGRDRIYGNSGNDSLFGQGGNDRLLGGKGRDRVNGGPGRDSVTVDKQDKVKSAEHVSRR
jgi:RTX calcium-binding nonapeptide repeat (4 copies)